MGLPERFMRNYGSAAASLPNSGVLSYLRSSSGYVLIIVLILTTLLVSIAGEFIVVAQINIGYGQKLKNQLKASYLAKSGVQLASSSCMPTSRDVSDGDDDREADGQGDRLL